MFDRLKELSIEVSQIKKRNNEIIEEKQNLINEFNLAGCFIHLRIKNGDDWQNLYDRRDEIIKRFKFLNDETEIMDKRLNEIIEELKHYGFEGF